MTPYEIFDICEDNLFENIDCCGGATNFAERGGEILGIMRACSYMEDADKQRLAGMLNQALFRLQERRAEFLANGGEDESNTIKGIIV
jgi:hypothetical protein